MTRSIEKFISDVRSDVRIPVAILWMTIVFFAGAGLRVAALGEPLWIDELHSAWCVDGSPGEVVTRAIIGNQSPLFFLMQYGVFQIFGGDEFALRLLPLASSLILLISIPWIVFRLSGSLVGAGLAMTLAAFDDSFLFYAVEARPYGLVQLAAVWQAWFFVRWSTVRTEDSLSRRPVAIWLAATSALLFYLHLTTVLILVTQLVLVLVAMVWKGTKLVRRFRDGNGVVFGCLAVACLPGLFLLAKIGGDRGDWQAFASANSYGLMMIAHLIVYSGIALVASVCFRNRRRCNDSPGITIPVLLAVLVTGPVLVCLAGTASGWAPLAHYRYSIASSTLLIVLGGVLFQFIRAATARTVAVAITLSLAILTNPLFAVWLETGIMPQQRTEQWKQAIAIITGDPLPVVVCPNLVEDQRLAVPPMAEMQEYYQFPVRGIYRVSDSVQPVAGCSMLSNQLLNSSVAKEIRQQNGCWLIVRARTADAEAVARRLCNQLRSPQRNAEFRLKKQAPVNLFRIEISAKPSSP